MLENSITELDQTERLNDIYEELGGSEYKELMCPITHQLIKDPVNICTGYTFDKKAI